MWPRLAQISVSGSTSKSKTGFKPQSGPAASPGIKDKHVQVLCLRVLQMFLYIKEGEKDLRIYISCGRWGWEKLKRG